ncbi:ThuA domain-containing protein [Prosthecobacter dejongeii]|uniref:Type 1 glutamine amidotransferase n=1 Tax=Prosthecobacter dejongeii TaxID=48465 RepID=A0A7W7YND2_9BACT|nr:ThuA domain-containing protein [Prosthecobacter dejongeii]MBB5039358.1 type 1 glutamine amidotransferase [Prosthecobacter dejongeii]
MIRRTFLTLTAALAGFTAQAADAPKKLLVVTVTTGFRHSSIETAEKVLAELGKSSGAFTVDYVHQPEGQPKNPGKAPEKKPNETDESFKAKQEAYSTALADYNTANTAWNEKVKAYMAENMAIEKIKGYDGFIFANTTGDLQFPDRDGFVELIKGGKAFVAMHSGGDTYHPFRGYVDMLGGEFQTHKAQVEVQPVLHDPAHPATKPVPTGWRVFDEIYLFKSYDPAQVHALMGLNSHPNEGTPGYYPVSWCKEFGKGKVFYTSLGHREDVWDPTWKEGTKDRKNSPEIAKTYQEHILGGIKWALGLVEGDAEIGNLKAELGPVK